jgi:MoaA/NifB/PqqE/SkfB family radical SAM enzyme
MTLKLRRLVVKPTLACTASCPTCALRLDLYEKRKYENSLTLEQWTELIEDAYNLGCRDLHISGGEPTLYPETVRLIEVATRLGITTNVNTNGSRIPPTLIQGLVNAGLGSITVSMYSWRPSLHDRMRQEPGLFNRAVESIKRLRKQPNLLVDLQTILARYNLLELDRFVEMAYDLSVGYIYVSYVEGDVEKRWLPTANQIQEFRREIVPKIKQIVDKQAPSALRNQALKSVEAIFSDDSERIVQFSQGLYHPIDKPNCPRPYNFALVLVNGEVHPCNGVEYSHEPVMGNIHNHKLSDLWQDTVWNQFRVQRYAWCHLCPMTLHFRIPIMGETK